MAQKVRDIMTGHPVCVPPNTEIKTVATTMRDEDIGAVLVTEGEDLRGLVTDRDLVVRALASDLGPQSSVGGLCSEASVRIGPDDDLDVAVWLMRTHSVRRLPVVDGTRPVGIISLGDIAIEDDPDSGLADISAAEPST
ncbi:CBS domain-containing protein [Actinomadura barringtoniae]|uniref:CBS domain-containing protein n=1 Tax=Actinomadura barringtoniae TaxID=1427535 RepID=A0A939PJC3_9ACTN|nr:CBS domain-containing protein [Actinomadura barringtoniae]MBO2450884.1 CBS domain-containing protein [Actinomadura barringtoniae]